MKRKLLLAATLALIGAGLLAWLRPDPAPNISGGISKEDSRRIQQTTLREMWRKAFLNASWQTMKKSPHSICLLATSRIREIEVLGGNGSTAFFYVAAGTNYHIVGDVQVHTRSHFGDYFYVLTKSRQSTGQWDWQVRMQGPQRLASVFRPYRGPESFGKSLSFGAGTIEMPHFPFSHAAGSTTATQRPAFTESEFSASLSNRARLTFGR